MSVPGAAWWAALMALASASQPWGTAAAQRQPRSRDDATTMAVFGSNVLLGGVTAATRALIGRRDPARAFALGALGGAVHFSGKLAGPMSGFPGGIPGVVLSATGVAMVSNAGRGVGLLDELYVPVGPLHVRLTPRESRTVHLSINAYETGLVVRNLARDGMRLDWRETAGSGTFAFVTEGKLIKLSNGRLAQGVEHGPVIVISSLAVDRRRIMRHEFVHVQQHQFAEEAIGRPIEDYLRRRIPGGRRIPQWLDLGVIPPALGWLDIVIFGSETPLYRLAQSEASMLESR